MISEPKQPLVSVIIPAYNAAKFIELTIESAANQTYKNIEMIVVDDGSTDETFAIVQRLADLDSRIRVFRRENHGVSATRNYAIEKARGEFIAPLDADDLWQPTNLEKQLACLKAADDQTAVSYSWSEHILENGSPRGSGHAYSIEGDVYATLLCHFFLGNASCTLIRKRCLDEVGYYTTALRESGADACEDWELYLRLASRYKFKAVPEYLVRYRRTAFTRSQQYKVMAAAHSMILKDAAEVGSVPEFLKRLSRSSLYLYLADQCAEFGTREETLEWLFLAYRSDCLTPLLRSDFYRLAIRSFVNLEKDEAKHEPRTQLKPNWIPQRISSLPRQFMGDCLHAALKFMVPRVGDSRLRFADAGGLDTERHALP